MEKQPMLTPVGEDDLLLCALSGGADSVCMTDWLWRQNGARVYAAHFNHLLRGAESDADEAFVKDFCAKRNIRLFCGAKPVGELSKARGTGIEETARAERYAFLEETAGRLFLETGKKVWILTAHTASDQAETVLFRLVRGSGMTGLSGIPYQRGKILRPLLAFTREEVEAYCQNQQLSYRVDATNRDVRFARNMIRHEVLPKLSKLSPKAAEHLAQSAEILQSEDAFLESLADGAYEKARVCGGLSTKLLLENPTVLQRRMLVRFLKEAGLSVDRKRVRLLEEMVLKIYAVQTISGILLRHQKGVLSAEKQSVPTLFEPVLLKDGETVYDPQGKAHKIQILDTTALDTIHNFYKKSFYPAFDCAKIKGVPVMRIRRSGDKIRLLERGCTKSIKKLFSEAAVPPDRREKLFVLADDKGVFYAESFGMDERVACSEETAACMILLSENTDKKEG